MVMYALALALLPLAMAGSSYHQQPMMNYPRQSNWGGQMGFEMQGTAQMVPMQQQNSNSKWWAMENQEEYEAYVKWCEERRLAIQEQEQQQALLKEIEERAHMQKRAHEREKAAKEMQMKRDAMVNQWKMWKSQLEQADEFDGILDKFMDMKIHYTFKLTTEFLKFCRCTDYASHLQRYLMYGKESYTPSVGEVFQMEGMEGIDSTNVDAVAQRAASMTQAKQVKMFFGGAVYAMCEGVKTYVQQVIAWEAQYNFLG